MYWPPYWTKQTETRTLPHPQNEYQWTVSDCWSCILGNLVGERWQTVVNEIFTAFTGKRESDTPPAPSWKWLPMERQWVLAFHHGWSPCHVAIIVYIHHFDCFCILKGLRIHSGSSINEGNCDCSGGCRRNILYLSMYKDCHVQIYECLWSSATHITEHARPKMVNGPLTLIFTTGHGLYCYLLFLYRLPTIP